MIKLLLELSNNPKGSEDLSHFAIKFLKRREEARLVVPSRLDYQQSDCHGIERDKASKDFYTCYTTTSFEN